MTPGEAPASAGGKWTKGPWTVAAPKTGEDVTVEARTPIHRNPVYIARVYGPGILSRDVETRDANARLIAAAPALAEALEALVGNGPNEGEVRALEAEGLIDAADMQGYEVAKCIAKARAALALARGEK